jgi:hypothetical protein
MLKAAAFACGSPQLILSFIEGLWNMGHDHRCAKFVPR